MQYCSVSRPSASQELTNSASANRHTTSQRTIALPRELLDIVVGQLQKEDLASCTLVSRYWRLSAVSQLFRRITIWASLDERDGSVNSRPISRAVDENDQILDIAGFYTFLCSEFSTHIQSYIKDMTIDSPPSRVSITTFQIGPLLQKLPALDTLQLRYVYLRCQTISHTPPGWASPRPLKLLRLYRVRMEPPSWIGKNIPSKDKQKKMGNSQCCFVDLLRLFSTIDTVQIDGSTFGWRIQLTRRGLYWEHRELALAAASQIPRTFHIQQLISSMHDTFTHGADDLQLLDSGGCLDDLRSLTLMHGQTICRRFLESVGSRLDLLHIMFPYASEDHPVRGHKSSFSRSY